MNQTMKNKFIIFNINIELKALLQVLYYHLRPKYEIICIHDYKTSSEERALGANPRILKRQLFYRLNFHGMGT